MFVLLTIVTGVLYPLLITDIAQFAMPHQANGSIIAGVHHADGTVGVGSELIGQSFTSARYFWSRPSATFPAYNGGASTGSNLGTTNPAQLDAVRRRVDALRRAQGDQRSPVPIDLVTASASGLDPHITPAAATYQTPRVARERGIPEDEVRQLVAKYTQGRTMGILGEPRVNVLQLNLALDRLE